ncbi:hypothetical protein GJAV_G00138700 [Gymnothorax javanicus]|nr:hypothetical protein GJAV_G00138700 [Gymnothorax javanicus]
MPKKKKTTMPKKKKTNGDKMTLTESVITFQSHLKRKEVADFEEEFSLLESKNQRFRAERLQLKEEQWGHIKSLHKQLKGKEGKLLQTELACRQEVELTRREIEELIKTQELELAAIQRELRSLKQRFKPHQTVRQIWVDYKLVGSKQKQRQIQQLDSELAKINKMFWEMSESVKWTMTEDMKKTAKMTHRKMEEAKRLASERAIKHLDKDSLQAIQENKWLKKTLNFYQLEASQLEEAVQKLEVKNLEFLSQLFDLQFCGPNILSDSATGKKSELAGSDFGSPGWTLERGVVCNAEEAPAWPAPLERSGQPADQPSGSRTREIIGAHYGHQPDNQDCSHLGARKLLNLHGQRAVTHKIPDDKDTLPPDLLHIASNWPITTSMILNRYK